MKVLSVINLKGGVGKSTLTVAIANVFAAEFRKRVLVIDLDPQTNSTLMLAGEKKWNELDKQGNTLFRLFDNALKGDPVICLEEILLRPAEILKGPDGYGEHQVHLAPSSIQLIRVQDRLIGMPSGNFHTRAPATVLQDAARSALAYYDLVLVDCPPNLGIITLNGLLISDGFIIPTIPDVLSTYGISQIVDRVGEFSKEAGKVIKPIGIVASKYRSQSSVHKTTVERLRKDEKVPVLFETIIKEADKFAGAAEEKSDEPLTVRQKWGYGGLADLFISLAEEIRQKMGIPK